ncbi:unnamed protein product [Rotaria magnacalcarata]|uniref:Uncharacterized protein n=2 Tax=Rotaria magnacalcarata TaxID=392030 RepID=A0A816ZLL6_9BILA|nr:unnamed protein product [Rotaria magnacalcarata]CAF2202606.1 unnamed protein product [Rotaria magnacalcarata]
MNHTLRSNYPTEPDEKIVALNQDIGYLLLKYLKGLDVISFMEAIDGSEQFNMIEISEDHLFYKVFMKIVKEEKMKVNVPYLHFYLDTCSIDEHGYLYPERYHSGETPILRLFIHPTFTVEAFENLCFTCKTPSFQCYGRLLPLNTYTYVGNFLLLDYFNYKDVPEITNPMSFVLHSSDIDISQVAFTGSHVFCTIAFLQAIATNSFICYTMHGDMERSICERIIRYCQRGFVFLEPQEFDNALYIDIMARNVLKEKREETREIMNDDGEIQIITITYEPRQFPYPNVDSHRLQETFIEQICRKKIE